jgi:hypothetical protein
MTLSLPIHSSVGNQNSSNFIVIRSAIIKVTRFPHSLILSPVSPFTPHKPLVSEQSDYNPSQPRFPTSRHRCVTDYRHFDAVIDNAKNACENIGNAASDHFVEADDMITLGKGAEREVKAVFLSIPMLVFQASNDCF